MPNLAISAQGTLLARNGVTIAELRNMKAPGFTRKEIDTTSHNQADESFRMGILRRTPMTLTIGFVPSLPTHDHKTGLIKAQVDNTIDLYKITWPDTTQWLFSGYVQNVGPSMPVDDGLTAEVTIRPTGAFGYVDGVAPTS